MNKNILIGICSALVLGAIWMKREAPAKKAPVAMEDRAPASSKTKSKVKRRKFTPITQSMKPSRLQLAGQSTPTRGLANTTEKATLEKMANIIQEFIRPNANLDNLVSILERNGQQPQRLVDKNPYTGELAILRTNSPLPGTRYFHAQHFSDAGKNGIVQHVSFEVQSSPTAMAESVLAMQDTFKLTNPVVAREGYVKWNLDNHKILWIKKLTSEDLQLNPFNAYTQEDVGTIRIAIEEEIHEG